MTFYPRTSGELTELSIISPVLGIGDTALSIRFITWIWWLKKWGHRSEKRWACISQSLPMLRVTGNPCLRQSIWNPGRYNLSVQGKHHSQDGCRYAISEAEIEFHCAGSALGRSLEIKTHPYWKFAEILGNCPKMPSFQFWEMRIQRGQVTSRYKR